MIYPGAFNLTTGPLHWELLQRARAVDNQMYVAACSPARDLKASYHAWGHSTIVGPAGNVIETMDENQGIIYADLGMFLGGIFFALVRCGSRMFCAFNWILNFMACLHVCMLGMKIDLKTMAEFRQNIPLTTQRRFDLYADVSKAKP